MPNSNSNPGDAPGRLPASDRLGELRRDNIGERQHRMREHHFRAAFNPDAAISGAWITVLPDGNVRTTVHHVERAQIPALLRALDELREDFRNFQAAGDAPGARVYVLHRRDPLNDPPEPVPRAA